MLSPAFSGRGQDGAFPRALEDVAARLGQGHIRGDIARGPCPCCGSRTGAWVRELDDGGFRVGCFGCGDWQGLRAALDLAGAGRSGPRPAPRLRAPAPEAAPDLVLEADRLDAVYRAFLKHLPMSSDQRRNVLGRDRGIPLDLRAQLPSLVAPLPGDPGTWHRTHGRLVAELKTIAPYEFLVRVPELAARAGRSLAVLHTRKHAQYFEPWADEHGRITALRAYMGRRAEPKYLTTGGRWGPLVHFAFGAPREEGSRVPWVFTEGWMKAEVLAHHLGVVGVALPGVSSRTSWRRAVDAHRRLAPEAPTYIAFDAEVWTTRPDIACLALEFARVLLEATGRCPGFAVWDAHETSDGKVHPKGIDDAIADGIAVRLVERAGFATYLGPALSRWESRHAA